MNFYLLALHFFSAKFRTEYMPKNKIHPADFYDIGIKPLFNNKDKSFHVFWLFIFVVYFNGKIYLQSASGSSLLVHKVSYVLAVQNQGKDSCDLICNLVYYVGVRFKGCEKGNEMLYRL